MSGVAWRPDRPTGPHGGRPWGKDRSRQKRRPGYSEDFIRPVNRRINRTTDCEEEDE